MLHGVQLWVALPDADRDTGRDFAHYAPQPRALSGATLRVFLGELAGDRSPVHTFTPLLGAQVDLEPGADLTLDVDPDFEHGVLLDTGRVEVDGTVLDVADLAFQADGCKQLNIVNRGDGPARAILLGGTPFREQLVMWWNFVGRSHEDIAAYRQMWEDGKTERPLRRGHRLSRHGVTPARASASERDVASATESRGIEGA